MSIKEISFAKDIYKKAKSGKIKFFLKEEKRWSKTLDVFWVFICPFNGLEITIEKYPNSSPELFVFDPEINYFRKVNGFIYPRLILRFLVKTIYIERKLELKNDQQRFISRVMEVFNNGKTD